MGHTFFAHAGHDHVDLAAMTPWWQDQFTVSALLVIGLAVMVLLAHFAFHANFGVKLTLVMAYLLVIGVACYGVAPLLSIISLTVGMALALGSVMLQLAHKNSPGK